MRRRGFTLTELVAVMAALAVVMGVSVVLLVQAFDFQRMSAEYSESIRTSNRLIADFRSDVRTHGKPEIPADGNTLLRWKTETETIDYVVEPGEFPDQQNIARTVQKDDRVFRENYHLPDRTTVWCVEGKDTDTGLVALSLWTTTQGTEVPNPSELNPFDRTLPKTLEQRIDPKYAGNWRTIVVRYNEKKP